METIHLDNPSPMRGFYLHPYGGWAKDFFVTRDDFKALFEVANMDVLDALPANVKLFDIVGVVRDAEIIGYKSKRNPYIERCIVVFIDRGEDPLENERGLEFLKSKGVNPL